jgi:hypothetical protein
MAAAWPSWNRSNGEKPCVPYRCVKQPLDDRVRNHRQFRRPDVRFGICPVKAPATALVDSGLSADRPRTAGLGGKPSFADASGAGLTFARNERTRRGWQWVHSPMLDRSSRSTTYGGPC